MSKRLDHFQFPAHLEGGNLKANNSRYTHGMLSMYEACDVIVHVERRRRGKSREQLGYLYGVVYPEISIHTGHSVEELDLIFKAKFLKNKVLWRGVDMIVPGTKSPLTSNELAEFITNVIVEAGELEIKIPPPDKTYQFKNTAQ